MQRLEFRLRDFTRIAWASRQCRKTWEPRLESIRQMWDEIEWMSVVEGLRRCAIVSVAPHESSRWTRAWTERDLRAVTLDVLEDSRYPYSSEARTAMLGHGSRSRVAVGDRESVLGLLNAWQANDSEQVGSFLGYPKCCRGFFKRVWETEQFVDTTWPMATGKTKGEEGTVVACGPPECNVLWRWAGMRAVPHLPCSFDCQPTTVLGNRFLDMGRNLGHSKEISWLLEILSWPVEWSALHGIAEIRTPILKVVTRTDATNRKYRVLRLGRPPSGEVARGFGFAYRPATTFVVGQRDQRIRATDAQGHSRRSDGSWQYRENGFSSWESMDVAHRPLVQASIGILSGECGNVLDLGCGNGMLLRRIHDANPGVVPFGIDRNPVKIAHASLLLPASGMNFLVGDMFQCWELWNGERHYTLAVLMLGRLLEAETRRARELVENLQRSSEKVLVYAYSDYLEQPAGLGELARKVGVRLQPIAGGTGVALLETKLQCMS